MRRAWSSQQPKLLLGTEVETKITAMPGPPAADWNMAHHPQMLPPDRIRSHRSHEEKKNPSGPDLMKVSSQTTPTLHITKTPNTAVPNGWSVTWEGRTGWKDRYFDTSRDSPRVWPGGNGSPSPTFGQRRWTFRSTPRSPAPGVSTAHLLSVIPVRPHSPTREITQRPCTSQTTHSLAPGPQSRAQSTHTLMLRATTQQGPSNRRLGGQSPPMGSSWHSNALPPSSRCTGTKRGVPPMLRS